MNLPFKSACDFPKKWVVYLKLGTFSGYKPANLCEITASNTDSMKAVFSTLQSVLFCTLLKLMKLKIT